jgi:hypothetical protein
LFPPQWLALAAMLLLVTGASVWVVLSSRTTTDSQAENRMPGAPVSPPTATPAPSQSEPLGPPRSPSEVFAVVLSPLAVRSASESPTVAIPGGTDLVAIRLEGEPAGRLSADGRAAIRTVEGKEVWKGAAIIEENVPPGILARIDVPAADLPVNDYVVTLYSIDAANAEQERARYFLRIRQR